jgi:hypothetical protein
MNFVSRFRRVSMSLLLTCAFSTLCALPAAPQATTGGGDAKASKAVLRFALRLTRQDVTDSPTDQAAPAAPVDVASPTLTTLDGDTASLSVAGADLSYNVSLSPTLQMANNAVQVLWNLRLAGKGLPGGATSATVTGGSRVTLDRDAVLAELTLTDPTTRKRSIFRLQGTVNRDASSGTTTPAATPPSPVSPPTAR